MNLTNKEIEILKVLVQNEIQKWDMLSTQVQFTPKEYIHNLSSIRTKLHTPYYRGTEPRKDNPTYIKLKPCTCGFDYREQNNPSNGVYYFSCQLCGKKGPEGSSIVDAKKKWNQMVGGE